MSTKSGIYQLIEDRLRASKDPLTCADLYDFEEIKAMTRDANRVSDYLGHMLKRGLVQRWYAAKSVQTKARYAYTWKEPDPAKPLERAKVEQLNIIRGNYIKPNVTITEEDNSITLDFAQFTITIQRKI